MMTNRCNPADRRHYPARWSMYRGKHLFQEVDRRSKSGTEELLTVSHITGITPRSQKNVNMFQSESLVGYKLCEVGDIAANTMWMWQGAIGVSRYQGLISPSYSVYRQRRNYYNPNFLDLLLREPRLVDVYHSLSTGIRSSRLRLYPDVFLTIGFPVPLREEQDQIVQFLDWKVSEINTLILSERKAMQALYEMEAKLIDETLSNACRHDGVVCRLKDVALCNVETLGESTPSEYEFRYVDISSVTLRNGIGRYQTMKFKDSPSRARRVVHKNDVIISTVRTYLRAIAKVEDDSDVVASTGFAVITPTKIDSKYLEYCMKSNRFCDEVARRSVGIAYPAIDSSELMNIKIFVPDYAEQQQIAKDLSIKCELIRCSIDLLNSKIAALTELKSVIISDVVTGKIDVRDIAIPEHEHVDDVVDDDSGDDGSEITGEEESL